MGNQLEQPQRSSGELIVRRGPDRGVRRPLVFPVMLIGSIESADLRVIDPLVRPVHAMISCQGSGAYLRAVGGVCTVNDIYVTTRELQSGDRIQLGEFELEFSPALLATVPLAEAVDEHETVTPIPVKHPRPTWKIITARGKLFQERRRLVSETNRDRQSLNEIRQEGIELNSERRAELARLRALRKRFIARWKRQWSHERERLEQLQHQLTHDRTTLNNEQRAFQQHQQELERTNQLQAKQLAECRQKRTDLETTLATREQEIAEERLALQTERQRLLADQTAFAQRRVALEYEIQALEERMFNVRTMLERTGPTAPYIPSIVADEPTATPLSVLADDLVDQQHSLQEIVAHVARTISNTRELGVETLHELEAIIRSVLDREEHVQLGKKQLLIEQARLGGWHTELTQAQLKHDQRQAELDLREHRVGRYEHRLKMLITEWQRRRKIEVAKFNAQMEQARHCRDLATAATQRTERREQELNQRRLMVAQRELAIEQARALFGEKDTTALQRCERKLNAVQAAITARVAEQQERIAAEKIIANQLIQQAHEQWVALVRQQRQLARKQSYLDHRQYLSDRDQDRMSHEAEAQTATLALAKVQLEKLQSELSKLCKLNEQLTRPLREVNRAA